MAEDYLQNELGRVMRPSELAKFLDTDVRTVKKYYYLWGGIRLSRCDYRFFEKLVKEAIYANVNNEKRQEAVERRRRGGRGANGEAFSGSFEKEPSDVHAMGGGNKKPPKDDGLADPHGLFD